MRNRSCPAVSHWRGEEGKGGEENGEEGGKKRWRRGGQKKGEKALMREAPSPSQCAEDKDVFDFNNKCIADSTLYYWHEAQYLYDLASSLSNNK